jgi:hypothetical protein
MTRPSTRLLAIARRIENAAHLYPDTEARLRTLVATIDGWPTHNGDPHRGGGADTQLTAVEAAAEARLRHSLDLADLQANIRALEIMAGEILDDCHRILRGGMAKLDGPRLCDPSGREGALVPLDDGGWADWTCREAASKAGLCARHYMAERRWRAANGYPARGDDAGAA